MCQFNILLIYSSGKGRKELTSFLYDNGFDVAASYHAIEEIVPMKTTYPDIVIIQPGIHAYLEIVSKVRTKFPSVPTVCSNGLLKSSLNNGFSHEELMPVLREERSRKKKRLINCVKQIERGTYFFKIQSPITNPMN